MPIIPFILFTGLRAISVAIAASFLVMIVLGVWIGRFSGRDMLWSAVKLAVLSLLTVVGSLLINALVA